jgi:hypothetical protein
MDTMTMSEAAELLKDSGRSAEDVKCSIDEIVAMDERLRKAMAPRGELFLPERLENARWRYGIPDSAFDEMPASDRVFIYRPKSMVAETFVEGGTIVRSRIDKARDRNETPSGILVAWGLKAMDELVPQGYEPGMMVSFVVMAPWMKPIGRHPADDIEDHVIVLRSDHIVGSKDLEAKRRELARRGEELITIVDYKTERGTISRSHTIAGLEKVLPVLQEDY